MSPNDFQPHVLVLPEDRANSELANGFLLDPSLARRSIQVLAEAGGWIKVLDCFESAHVARMHKYPQRHMVLLIDFDGHDDRLTEARRRIPADLEERVFVLGSMTKPEDLKRTFGLSPEKIGTALARDCREDTNDAWGHDLLKHNTGELNRMRERVRPILFPSL
jgi:hypothetical protein